MGLDSLIIEAKSGVNELNLGVIKVEFCDKII